MSNQRLIRLISTKEHKITQDELVDIIKKTGTDKYDPKRKHIFYDYYGKHDFDFFAEKPTIESLEEDIAEAIRLFPGRTKGDRGYEVIQNIIIIYNGDECEELDEVYDYKSGSDCFKFKSNPLKALVEVRTN